MIYIYIFFFYTIGKLYDQCQDTLVQFGTFLGSTMTVDEYVERLPSIHSMLQDNHIHADVAFFLARPMFAHAINVSAPLMCMHSNFLYNNIVYINHLSNLLKRYLKIASNFLSYFILYLILWVVLN